MERERGRHEGVPARPEAASGALAPDERGWRERGRGKKEYV